MSKKKLIIFIASVALSIFLISLTIFSAVKNRHLSDYERLNFKKESATIMNYFETIDNDINSDEPEQLDKYVAFAMLYSFNENDQTELSVEEIKNIISTRFSINIDARPLESMGITPFLANYSIQGFPSEERYVFNAKSDSKTIANTPVTKYILKDVKKSGKKYIAKYTKYVAEDPYTIFNYASDNHLDSTGIGDYLKGKGKIANIKKLITPENADEVAKAEKDITVTFEVADSGLRVVDFR